MAKRERTGSKSRRSSNLERDLYTEAELLVFDWLTRRGIRFAYENKPANQSGDFILTDNKPPTYLRVQARETGRDIIEREQIKAKGYRVVDIPEDIIGNVDEIMEAAIDGSIIHR